MNEAATRTILAALLQVLALAALLLALAGVRWLDLRAQPGLLVLVDRSLSVPRPAADAALTELRSAASHGRIALLEFAGRTGPDVEPSSTNLEQALDAALANHAQRPFASAVVISDGRTNAGDSERALRSAREAGLPLRWLSVARPAPAAWITDVQAPSIARRGQAVQVTVPLGGDTARPLRVAVNARDASGAVQSVTAETGGRATASVELQTAHGGPLHVALTLRDARTNEVLDARRDAAAVDVVEAARLLYLQGSAGPLARSLVAGGWSVEAAPARRADAYRERLGGYEAVVLDDVSLDDASRGFWQALVAEVTGRGLGLLVLGGERSFARGGYRESALESVVPVLSEPAALDQPASVVFAVDKSGSMGEGSRGVNRLSLAERAVLETARTLGERDAAGVVVFDIEPRVLLPLVPAATAVRSLEGSWPVQARGGTRLAPAIELATGQFAATAAGRRILVVVTDGFVDEDAPLDALRGRLAAARIEVVALAVGPDADVTSLARLTSADSGVVLRVGEAAELPRAMSNGLERRRARIERGRIAVEPVGTLPLLAGRAARWPDIAAYAVTRLRPEASAWLESGQGDPVLAVWQAGTGRVVAVTSGLGPWTPQWLAWVAWPELAGGLAAWVSGSPGSGNSALEVTDTAEGLVVEADLQQAGEWAAPAEASLAFVTPTGRTGSAVLRPFAPGRLRAVVPTTEPGAYQLVASSPLGVQRVLHLRDSRAEHEGWGVDPAVERWIRDGLVQRWDAAAVAPVRLRSAVAASPDRGLMGLALLLFCTGVLVDRLPRGRRAA